MKHEETAFLAQIAIGWFTVKEDGSIWRHVEWHGGGAPSFSTTEPRRAECSKSSPDGYPRVLFHHQGQRLKVSAHRIVWIVTNRRPIPEAMEINHKDGNKANAHPSNLELVTRAENVRHAIRVLGKKRKARLGTDNAQAKLTEAQVMEIRGLAAAKALTQREIAARFGLTQSAVSAIVLRKSWAHLDSTG